MRHASQDKVGIYLVAANRLLREALARALSAEPDFDVTGACAPGPGAEGAILASRASIVLVDDFGVARSDLKLLTRLHQIAPSLLVVLLGMPEAELAFIDSVNAGAMGYVVHDASTNEFISAVRAVLNGEGACPPRMIISLYKYQPGSGIACPKFAHTARRIPHTSNKSVA
jgi:DNA-binding NarL/FixJ family response regulator